MVEPRCSPDETMKKTSAWSTPVVDLVSRSPVSLRNRLGWDGRDQNPQLKLWQPYWWIVFSIHSWIVSYRFLISWFHMIKSFALPIELHDFTWWISGFWSDIFGNWCRRRIKSRFTWSPHYCWISIIKLWNKHTFIYGYQLSINCWISIIKPINRQLSIKLWNIDIQYGD